MRSARSPDRAKDWQLRRLAENSGLRQAAFMGEAPPQPPALSVGLTPEGATAQVSEGTLSKVGQAAAWLFPKKNAKAKVTAALADRVAEKIRSGAPLEEAERYLVSRLFEREARALENSEQAAEVVRAVLPETSKRMAELPPLPSSAEPSDEFVRRAESVASDIGERDIRDLFARVVAGEISRAGSFSLRTLEIIRHLDPDTARQFRAFCNYIVDGTFAILTGDAEQYLLGKGFDTQAQFEFEDAGLVASGSMLSLEPGKTLELRYGEKRARFRWENAARQNVIPEAEWITLLRLTRTGYEIALALPFSPDPFYFDAVMRTGKAHLRERGTSAWTSVPGDDAWALV
jgi:hypothetical protein